MSHHAAPQPAVRPYFLPASIDWGSLPEPVQHAFAAIVAPAYTELVLGAPNALERSMGASFVFLLAEEVLDHFAIGRQMDLAQTQLDADREQREKAMSRYLKLLGAKNSALHALLRLRKLPPLFRFAPPQD